jgi:hypothetical protein
MASNSEAERGMLPIGSVKIVMLGSLPRLAKQAIHRKIDPEAKGRQQNRQSLPREASCGGIDFYKGM